MREKKYKYLVLIIAGIILSLEFAGLIAFLDFKNKQPKASSFVSSPEISYLNNVFENNPSLHFVGVFKEDEYITVHGFTINLEKHTFGENPEIGFIHEYYQAADSNPITTSVEHLLTLEEVHGVTEADLIEIKENMKRLGVTDISKNEGGSNDITYFTHNSAMWNTDGFIITSDIEHDSRINDPKFHIKKITDTVYGFSQE